MTKVIGVKFKESGKIYFFDPLDFDIEKDRYVIVETARGTECGRVAAPPHREPEEKIVKPLKPVTRLATREDVERMNENRRAEKEAFRVCCEKIEKHGLDMKLVDVEYTFDRSKLLFYFTADGRVDFRELVRDLARVFRTRIELRQIGVRDESKMMGGIGVCGQPFCCSRFLSGFTPVSIRMAKEQGLSLNPAKISGSCGRLMCCLSYEQDVYEYLSGITPPVSSLVKTPDGVGTVTEVRLIAGKLKVSLEKNRDGAPREYAAGQVSLLRRPRRSHRPEPEDEDIRALEDSF